MPTSSGNRQNKLDTSQYSPTLFIDLARIYKCLCHPLPTARLLPLGKCFDTTLQRNTHTSPHTPYPHAIQHLTTHTPPPHTAHHSPRNTSPHNTPLSTQHTTSPHNKPHHAPHDALCRRSIHMVPVRYGTLKKRHNAKCFGRRMKINLIRH